MIDRPPRRALLVLLPVLLALAVPGRPQQPAEGVLRGRRTDVVPGLRQVEIRRLAQGGAMRLEMLELDRATARIAVDLALAPEGPWSPFPMERAVFDAGSLGGFVVAAEPSLAQPAAPPGILFDGATLWAWPGAGPHLAAGAEGTWRLFEPPSGTGVVADDDGTTIPLASVNGAPGPPGTVGIVCGAFDGRGRGGLPWPAGTLAVPLLPGPANREPGPSLWDSSLGDEARSWRPRQPVPLESLRLASGDWALLVPPDLDAPRRDALAATRSLRVAVDLPPEVRLAVWMVPAGRWIDPADTPEEPAWRAFLGVSATGDRLWLVESGGGERGEFPFSPSEAADILTKEGAAAITELPPGVRRLIPDARERRTNTGTPSLPARVALLPRQGVPEIRRDTANAWEPLPVALADGSNVLDPRNGPKALVDGAAGPDDLLRGIWIAPVPQGRGAGPAWFELRFHEPAPVEAVDLLHASLCGFSPHFNLRAFRLLGRTGAAQPWEELAVVRHDDPTDRERVAVDSPRSYEALRLEVLEANFVGGANARLGEVIVWGRRTAERR